MSQEAINHLHDALGSLQKARKILGKDHPAHAEAQEAGFLILNLITDLERQVQAGGSGDPGANEGQGLADTVGLIEGINDLKKQGLL